MSEAFQRRRVEQEIETESHGQYYIDLLKLFRVWLLPFDAKLFSSIRVAVCFVPRGPIERLKKFYFYNDIARHRNFGDNSFQPDAKEMNKFFF